MIIHIINTGRELMLGRVLNSHQQWLCQQLARQGHVVERQVAVDDSAGSIQQAVQEALQVADLVITTGGLGPTNDDRTRDLIAGLMSCSLKEDPAVVRHIEGYFAARNRPCPDRVKVQAQVPEGATVLMNENGTAPGLVMETCPRLEDGESGMLIMLPGPPRELRPMFTNQVLPLLARKNSPLGPLAFRILRTTGIGESSMEEKLHPLLQPYESQGFELGLCARPSEVDIQLLVRGQDADRTMETIEGIVRDAVGSAIYGTNDDHLEHVLVNMLRERRTTLALAESCTGGYIAHRVTNVPGASEIFLAGLVTYSNAVKQSVLGVRQETLEEHGAVSAPVAREMAVGAREKTGADYAISATGIAGPSGGSEAKPVGTVYLALAGERGVKAVRYVNPYNRETFKQITSQQALDWLRRTLIKNRGQTLKVKNSAS